MNEPLAPISRIAQCIGSSSMPVPIMLIGLPSAPAEFRPALYGTCVHIRDDIRDNFYNKTQISRSFHSRNAISPRSVCRSDHTNWSLPISPNSHSQAGRRLRASAQLAFHSELEGSLAAGGANHTQAAKCHMLIIWPMKPGEIHSGARLLRELAIWESSPFERERQFEKGPHFWLAFLRIQACRLSENVEIGKKWLMATPEAGHTETVIHFFQQWW